MENDSKAAFHRLPAKHMDDRPTAASSLPSSLPRGQQVLILQSRGACDAGTGPLLFALLATVAICVFAATAGSGFGSIAGSWQWVMTSSSGADGGSAAAPWLRRPIGRGLVPKATSVGAESASIGGQTVGAFVMLVGPNQTRGLELALQSLHLAILRYNPRPVLLFFGDDIPVAESSPEVIDKVAPPEIRKLIEIHRITGFVRETLPRDVMKAVFHKIEYMERYPGYHAMCHWFFVRILRHPRIRQLDYYFRMDTDTRFPQPVREDLFDLMARGNYSYAYVWSARERGSLTEGLWDLGADYMTTHFTEAQQKFARANGFWNDKDGYKASQNLQDNKNFAMIWNEVEMIDVRRFHQRDIMGFAEVVEDTHHIYDRRWGDSPLRHVQVRMFLNRTTEVKCLRNPVNSGNDKKNKWLPTKELLEAA